MDIKSILRRTIALGVVLFLAGIPGVAQSDLVTKTFIATILEGPLEGEFGTGSFSYDNDILGDDIIGPAEGLTVSFNFEGQVFNETNDQSFDLFPELVFENFVPVELDFFLTDGVNGVNFTNPLLLELEMEDALLPDSGSGNFDFETELSAEVVPIPAAAWLLGAGLIGLLGLKRRFQH
jgi:hypothetical protein